MTKVEAIREFHPEKHMRSYFVDVTEGDELLCDTGGERTYSFEEAKEEAISALAELIRIRMPDRDTVVSISIRDDKGHTVFTASAACTTPDMPRQHDGGGRSDNRP